MFIVIEWEKFLIILENYPQIKHLFYQEYRKRKSKKVDYYNKIRVTIKKSDSLQGDVQIIIDASNTVGVVFYKKRIIKHPFIQELKNNAQKAIFFKSNDYK